MRIGRAVAVFSGKDTGRHRRPRGWGVTGGVEGGGGGGSPLSPCLLFSKWGVPSPQCAGPPGGYPPPPQGPAGRSGDPPQSRKTHKPYPSRRQFHANHRIGPCRKGAGCGQGGEGGPPYPPSLLFSRWGVPSPHVAERVGGTPSPSCGVK